ncbi:uncharacterized protein LOC130809714 isoform X2 [Amaranthus tricolor]|uniref:uncharacterized protein LOC130809714 isoform X2 n=1 Tax=Amaranthus tricolor TaxID=29722 RepID=UPI00258EC495|nr:uncharacterized protein LOC130809714 isoform X2 [Amaranthus tricolor]
MDAQQQQQQQYQYQYQAPSDPVASQSYDPSQIQSYDQSYYAYQYPSSHYNQTQQQQDYSSYYYQDYSTYQTQIPTADPNSIHPPGVPITADLQQTHIQNAQHLYYPHGVVASQNPPQHVFSQAGGSQPGRSMRGRGAFGRHGRGRGGGRGKPQATRSSAPVTNAGAQSVASSAAEGQAATSKQPVAWCEICRTDCTTLEVLEQHKNGKRHKKNLKVHEDLQNLSRQLTMTKPDTIPDQATEGSTANHPPSDNVASVQVGVENGSGSSGLLPSQESVRMDNFGGRGGFKRKLRGGRGGKLMRAFDGSRRPVEPPKPKQVASLICELCNVKCESQVVFQSHVVGKKHLANLKRFQGHKEALGDAVQALYPSFNIISSTSSIPQVNQQGVNQQINQDAQALASMMLSQQNLQDPQAAQTALAELLHQHGIHDAQTLIAQLVPYLVAQFQAPGALPVPVAGFAMPGQNPASQEAHVHSGTQSDNVAVENQTEAQNVTSNTDSQTAAEENKPTVDVLPENKSQH